MKVASLTVYRYDLPLTRPLPLRGRQLMRREGLIVKLAGPDGAVGLGEIAPLPGLSQESLKEARRQAVALGETMLNREAPLKLSRLDGGLAAWIGSSELAPSVRCGFEMALLNLVSEGKGVALNELLGAHPVERLLLNGLLDGPADEIRAGVQRMADAGYKAVKLKVGRGSLDEDIALVREIRSALPSEVSLRLDANRAWSFQDGAAFGQAVADCAIEYIEEPLAAPRELEAFVEATGMAVALDETLCDEPDLAKELAPIARAFVIKPTRLGGFEASAQLVRWSTARNIYSVFSSFLETGIGLKALANLASALGRPEVPAGLDTAGWFADDLLEPPMTAGEAVLSLPQLNTLKARMASEHITEVYHA